MLLSPWGIVAIIVVIALIVVALDKSPANGYYLYKGAEYYYQNDSWYNYDPDGNTWNKVYDDDELDSTINSDTYSDYRTYDHEGRDFEDSIWYDTGSSDDDDDWDSDSFWDSDYDSWDSDSTDWDSDW